MEKKLRLLYILVLCVLCVNCSSDDPDIDTNFVYNEIEIGGTIWMDRNLGAKSLYDAGWYFQWGRPADGHQIADSDTSLVLSVSAKPNHGRFILAGIKKHWMEKPVYDYFALTEVCPDGWRVPDREDYEKLLEYISFGEREGVKGCMVGYLFFPETGYRGFSGTITNLDLFERGVYKTHYLTRDVSDEDIYTFSIRRGYDGGVSVISVSPEGRASFGYPIRCIKGRKDY